MAPTVAIITRRRATLKTRITTLDTALSQGKIDKLNARLRLARLTEVFKEYEALHDELALLEPTNEGLGQLDELQDSYYAIACKVEAMHEPGSSGSATRRISTVLNETPLANSTFIERQRLLKLPVADLPKFDGDCEKWLSFKNTFLAMIDSRADVEDLNKFLYLRGSLTGPAFNKLTLYNASAENYRKAWDLLIENYEKKRILIAKHFDALLDISPSTKASTEGLKRIVDEARQHMSILETLGARPTDGLVVRLLERKLPSEIRRKWEETLTFDVFPDLEQFCRFISESAFRLSSFDQEHSSSNDKSFNRKRQAHRAGNNFKTKRTESGARALVTSSFITCVHCKGSHPLYKCLAFAALTIHQRVEVVKAKKLCKNCLREHKDPCPSIRCKLCNKFHHTLLHFKTAPSHTTPKRNAPPSEPGEGTNVK